MSDTHNVLLNSKLARQIVIYTDAQKTPENSYPLPPRGIRTVVVNTDQLAYLRANYSQDVLIVATAVAAAEDPAPVTPENEDLPEEGNGNG